MKKIIGVFAIASVGGLTALGLNHLISNSSSVQTSQMAELIPTNSPFAFTKAPPLFPGFTAASVCI